MSTAQFPPPPASPFPPPGAPTFPHPPAPGQLGNLVRASGTALIGVGVIVAALSFSYLIQIIKAVGNSSTSVAVNFYQTLEIGGILAGVGLVLVGVGAYLSGRGL